MRHKKNFLLLELLIAITLLSLCAIPLLSSHPKQLSHKIRSIQQVERERIATLLMTEIIEMLEKQKISWGLIPPLGKESNFFTLKDQKFYLCNHPDQKAKAKYSFHTIREKVENNEKTYRLVVVKIVVDETQFRYRVIVHHS
jgi:hypothetical protein